MSDKEIIKQIMLDNQMDVSKHEVIPRDFQFEEFGNYVFVGIRRAGKSYLLYQRIQQYLSQDIGWDEMFYISFDDERLDGFTARDFNLLLEAHLELYGKQPIMFLDEVQNIDGWEKFAVRMANNKRRVYITGSNAKMLSKEIESTLGGRYITVNVYPYNLKEFLNVNGIVPDEKSLLATESRAEIMRLFNDYFRYGGFPEGATLSSKRDYLTSVYQKIYLGDIAARHKVENLFALRIMFKKIAESVKQPLSFNRIANIVSSTGAKVSTDTVIKYVEYAKDAWLITPIHNIAAKLSERESAPKYYFTDNGILNLFLLDGNTSLLENLVATNLLRLHGREDAVFFYNDKVEVDFYLPERETAIQVCYNLNNTDGTFDREVQALVKLNKVLPCRKLMIITFDEERTLEMDDKTIEVVPVWKWLLNEN